MYFSNRSMPVISPTSYRKLVKNKDLASFEVTVIVDNYLGAWVDIKIVRI